ncbi:hypothetical protein KKA00_06130, partial [bacterium]|nr:hypothetical protein [bacterium]
MHFSPELQITLISLISQIKKRPDRSGRFYCLLFTAHGSRFTIYFIKTILPATVVGVPVSVVGVVPDP